MGKVVDIADARRRREGRAFDRGARRLAERAFTICESHDVTYAEALRLIEIEDQTNALAELASMEP